MNKKWKDKGVTINYFPIHWVSSSLLLETGISEVSDSPFATTTGSNSVTSVVNSFEFSGDLTSSTTTLSGSDVITTSLIYKEN